MSDGLDEVDEDEDRDDPRRLPVESEGCSGLD